jgi:two-component system, LytTR family, sensor histidine kinase AlgZ
MRTPPNPVPFPDFRRPSILLRAIGLVLLVRMLWWSTEGAEGLWSWATWGSGLFEIALVLCVGTAFLLAPRLITMPYLKASSLLLAVTGGVTAACATAVQALLPPGSPSPVPMAVLACWGMGGLCLVYFHWRHLRLSPALAETRLMALQSRIQPHFLFNSINSSLALVRTDPAKAEAVLQDMADLFRAVLSDSRKLVPLADELRLARAYIDIETIRLGSERLQVQWMVQHAPLQAQVPPLLLQPLLENAVRHAVEPAPHGAQITVEIYQDGSHMRLFVRNPLFATATGTTGHQMALDNLRERLALHFDHEAALKAQAQGDEFVVQAVLPLQ